VNPRRIHHRRGRLRSAENATRRVGEVCAGAAGVRAAAGASDGHAGACWASKGGAGSAARERRCARLPHCFIERVWEAQEEGVGSYPGQVGGRS
jgi:hypothetical protein